MAHDTSPAPSTVYHPAPSGMDIKVDHDVQTIGEVRVCEPADDRYCGGRVLR
jgi:hypothetical protein